MNIIASTAYRIFGRGVRESSEKHRKLRTQIRKAHIPVPIDQYLSSAYLYSLIAGLAAAITGTYAGLHIFDNVSIPPGITAHPFVDAHLTEIMSSAAGLLLFTLVFYITYFVFRTIPATKVSVRRSHIDQSLPQATAYLYALSRGGGMNLFEIFKSLSGYTHVYGAAAEEFGYIVKDMEYFGHDLITALQTASERTASEQFKDFLDGLISIVSSGGDITEYLRSKTDQYRSTATREQRNFLETLGILAEVYISVFVVGPLFMMTILAVLGLMSSGTTIILYVLVYAIIPFGTGFFLLLLDMISGESKAPPETYVAEKELNVFYDVRVKPPSEEYAKRIKRIKLYKKLSGLSDALTHPFRLMRYKPAYAFLISIPLAIAYLSTYPRELCPLRIGTSIGLMHAETIEIVTALDDYVFFAVMLMLTPFIIFYELRSIRIRKIEEHVPEFLKRLASINAAGILLVDAIAMVAQAKIGILHTEVKRMVEDVSWSTTIVMALTKFEYRIRTRMTSRVITLIVKASESTSDVRSGLTIAANDADVQKQMKKERSAEMFVYVFIIYISFFVFLFTVYILVVNFLGAMPQSMDEAVEGMPITSGFDITEYTMLFFHAALIQGFCSGLVAGKMGSGYVSAGLKHSAIMMLASYGVFTTLI
ncbi:MAG: type II secretion system F family protein [Euryarchaeota archaeon]|nr:type II secretion system F family protein [Euryarchaeota archaeon]